MTAKLALVVAAFLLLPRIAEAQNVPVYQMGTALQNDLGKFQRNGEIRNSGGITGDNNGIGANPFSVTDYKQLGFCSNSGPTSGPYSQLCIGHDTAGNGVLSIGSFNGEANHKLIVELNGAAIDVPGLTTAPVCANILAYGALPDGATDTKPAWDAALAAHQDCLYFPAGTYRFSAAVSYTMGATKEGLSLQGSGSALTRLVFTNAGGITVNYHDKMNSVAFSGFSVLNDATGGTGITLSRTTSDTTVSLNSPPSTLEDVSIGYNASNKDWATCFAINGVTNVNYHYIACNNTPQSGYGGTVNGLVITGTAANPSVVHNISGANFSWGNCGIVLNAYVEGVTVTGGSNFTIGNKGICVPTGMPNKYYQLNVSDSQFNNNIGIEDLSGFYNSFIHDNVFILPPNAKGIYFGIANYVLVHNNTFNGTTATPNSTVGVDIATSLNAQSPINQVTGNQFGGLDIAIRLGAVTRGNQIGFNAFVNNVTNILNNGPTDFAGSNVIVDQILGRSPALTAGAGDCGTAPGLGEGSNDAVGSAIIGTGSTGAQCTLTFGVPFAKTPFCIAQNVTNPGGMAAASPVSTTGFVIKKTTATAFSAGDHITYRCSGYQ